MTDSSQRRAVARATGPGRPGKATRSWLVRVAWLLAMPATLSPPLSAAEPREGQSFEDWAVHCEVPRGLQEERCFIFQNLVRRPDGDRLLHLAAGYLTPDDGPAVMVTLPLGVSLEPGIGLRVDDKELVRFGFKRCDEKGCFGAVALDETMLVALRTGQEVRVHFQDGNGHEITVPVSLRGFGAGLDALR